MANVQLAVAGDDTTQVILSVPGVQGPAGSNLPPSGTTHQLLYKQSSTDYDTAWKLITNDNVDAAAEIAVSKLADGSARQLLQTDAAGTGVEWTSNVDIPGTLDVTSAATFDAAVTTTGLLSASGKISVPLASGEGPSIYFGTDTDTGIYSPGANQVALSTNGTGRLFVSANGVGIGAAEVTGYGGLQVRNNFIYLNEDGANTKQLYIRTETPGIQVASNDPFRILTNSQERLRITEAGLVGIGTSGPSYTLDVAGAGRYFSTTTDAASLYLSKTNSGTADQGGNKIYFTNAGPAATGRASGTLIGALQFQASEPSSGNLKNCGAIEVTADGTQSGAFTPTKLQISTSDTVFSGNRVAMTIDSSQRVGIGTTSPSVILDVTPASDNAGGVNGVASGSFTSANRAAKLNLNFNSIWVTGANQPLAFGTEGSERARIDSSGRLLVGTASTSVAYTTALLQGSAGDTSAQSILRLARGASTPASGDALGVIAFSNSSHSDGANIYAARDGGTWSASSLPTALVFSVTADGASTPTEAMRIKNSRILNLANTPVYADNAAAKTGGLVDGDVYRKSDGTLMIVYT